jgi:hypothetical protein
MSVLYYRSWELDWPEVVFTYEWDGGTLRKTLGLGGLPRPAGPDPGLDNLLAHAGLACARYFFKLADFDQVHVEPLRLPPPAVRFFELSFQTGVAEMRYRNGLDVSKPVAVSCSPDAPQYEPAQGAGRRHALLLNGGGKDTAVAGEILKEIGLPFTWLTVHSPVTEAMKGIVEASGVSSHLHLEHRAFDPEVARRARYKDALAPRLGFLSLIPAYLTGASYVVTANEHSANYGNVKVGGIEINHQHGKSLRAERSFSKYVETYLLRGVRFFSLLAPLYELQIASVFARHPQYFGRFLSCNVGQRRNAWCGECPKCAFVHLILAPFLDAATLWGIFGRDLFATEKDCYWLRRLTLERKPFECVGTKTEAKLALHLALERHARPDGVPVEDWEELRQLCAGIDPRALADKILRSWDRPHAIPGELAPAVLEWYTRNLGG